MRNHGGDPAERRAERRRPARGPVILRQPGGPEPVWGSLVDIANRGFRVRHKARELQPGQEVDFEISGLPGRARVVWTRIIGDRVESGFHILTEGGH